ncbi:putative Thioredoxin-like superfamily [Helianthus annuus]|uniref:Thioredoxin-like superfamily n=2 Tax=Helianthus annuus TaxID=4232 RepID=A0A9K3J6T8_HELAN|nr:putative Thioredoxin-like superfamily [Helianthus annuus]
MVSPLKVVISCSVSLRRLGSNTAFPTVFVGGKYLGSTKEVISQHIDGTLKRKLIEAKAILL